MNHIMEKGRLGFIYRVEVLDKNGVVDESQTEVIHNLMPTEGLNHVLDIALKGGTPFPTWYLGLYRGNYTPQPTDTMSSFPSAAVEVTTQYDESARVTYVPGSIANGAVDNVSNKAEFTFNEAVTVYGGFLSSGSAKGNTSGVLLSAVRFASPKSLSDEGILRVTAGFTFVSV